MIPSHLPIEPHEWASLVSVVAAKDDRVESYVIERKGGELNPGDKDGAAKIAKFVLGAANRGPGEHLDVLDGHAALFIGIEKDGTISGAMPVERHELRRRVEKYTGVLPKWSIQWVPMDDEREVLVILVRPCSKGDPLHVCMADGPGVYASRTYIRRDGETSEASPEEIRGLVERASAAGSALPTIKVRFVGSARSFTLGERDFAGPINGRALMLLGALEEAQNPTPEKLLRDLLGVKGARGLSTFSQALEEPESRDPDDYREQVETWRSTCLQLREEARETFIPFTRTEGFFEVENTTEQYLDEVEVKLHIPGSVLAHFPEEGEIGSRAVLPNAPRKWGPRRIPFGPGSTYVPQIAYPPQLPRLPGDNGATFRNGGSVDVTLTLKSLRPLQREVIDDDPIILEVEEDFSASRIVATWTATAARRDGVMRDETEIAVGESFDLGSMWLGG